MSTRVHVSTVGGRRLELTARHHAVHTDRPLEDGGTDEGCTSGELLLMAIGSCAVGSLCSVLKQGDGVQAVCLTLDVFFEPTGISGQRDRIVVAVTGGGALSELDENTIRKTVICGGVTSRLNLGSEIDIRII